MVARGAVSGCFRVIFFRPAAETHVLYLPSATRNWVNFHVELIENVLHFYRGVRFAVLFPSTLPSLLIYFVLIFLYSSSSSSSSAAAAAEQEHQTDDDDEDDHEKEEAEDDHDKKKDKKDDKKDDEEKKRKPNFRQKF